MNSLLASPIRVIAPVSDEPATSIRWRVYALASGLRRYDGP